MHYSADCLKNPNFSAIWLIPSLPQMTQGTSDDIPDAKNESLDVKDSAVNPI